MPSESTKAEYKSEKGNKGYIKNNNHVPLLVQTNMQRNTMLKSLCLKVLLRELINKSLKIFRSRCW